MANRSDCKSFVRAEPIFHSKFCIKTHPHHTKLLCSWGSGGGGGGGGGGTGYAGAYPTGVTFTPATGFSIGGAGAGGAGTGSFMGHHEHHHPPTPVPTPVVGGGVVGLVIGAALLVALARKRKVRT
jgi:hypothetical protein